MGHHENYQLSMQHDNAQQFNTDIPEEQSRKYNSETQRSILVNSTQSFNEQRDNYTEQAFNNYDEPPPAGTSNTEVSGAAQQAQNTAPAVPQQGCYDYELEGADTVGDEAVQQEFQRRFTGRTTETANAGLTVLADKLEKGEKSPRYKSLKSDNKITLGAETPEVMRLSQKIHKDRIKIDKIHSRLKETKVKTKTVRVSSDKKDRLNIGSEKGTKKERLYDKHNISDREGADKLKRSVDDVFKRKKPIKRKKLLKAEEDDERLEFVRIKIKSKESRGRLRYQKIGYEKLTSKEYNKKIKEQDNKELKKRVTGRLMFSKAKEAFNDENIQDDEIAAETSKLLKRGYRTAAFTIRRNEKSLRNMYNPYERLKYMAERESYHTDKRQRLNNKNVRQQEKDWVKEAETKEERKRRKKEMQRARTEREGNFRIRMQNQLKMTKKSVEYRRHTVKRTLKTLAAVCSIAGIFFLSGFMIMIMIMLFMQGSEEYYAEAVVQADYDTITEATEYFRNLETDLEEYLSDKASLQAELKSEYGSDIYEFHYDICEFGFSANTVLAYVAAKYNDFMFDDTIKNDLKEVFQEMYILTVYTQMEDREVTDTSITDENGNHPTKTEKKKICYVTLSRTELEEIVESRLTEDELKLYRSYKLSTGGQQVYGPVMQEDWTNLISSNYGDRIHPITGVRTTHKGVDIAVPTGTKLYSAVKGTVTVARYSETAGNMVTIENSTGWTVTFMHMDSIAVRNGQKVEQGDFVGTSGNTGNSTGPHLHLQVNTDTGSTINPIFIIPQTCAGIGGGDEE